MLPFEIDDPPASVDPELDAVEATLRSLDPDGFRMGRVFRATFDQLYDGQRTGRYRWDQLFKTEKTHYGTLIEINLQREFEFQDGLILDYRIAGFEVDSKYSATAQWMLPPESLNHLILGSVASDQKSMWSVGLVRATPENRNAGQNRDAKGSLNTLGRSRIRWLFRNMPLQPNILLHVPTDITDRIFNAGRDAGSGQARINEMLRLIQNKRITRTTIETVGRQKDPMKRLRTNGGARTTLRPEGFLILSGDYANQKTVAAALGTEVPEPGEVVSARVVPDHLGGAGSAYLEGQFWRLAVPGEIIRTPAPGIT